MADDSPVVARSVHQRLPQSNEPLCVICARYGAYVCDATDEDVCSLECRDVCVSRQKQQIQETQQQFQRSEQLRAKLGIKISSKLTLETVNRGTSSTQWPTPFVDFAQEQEDAQLPEELLTNLRANGFERPTPVQMQTIPCVLQKHNVLVSAPTGTGKTASYLIPVIAQVLHAREDQEEILSLVLAPVRELAIQIETVAKLLMKGIADMKTALLVGGFPVPSQRYRLQNGVQLIVATPGRFLDIFTNYSGGGAILAAIRTCIVDEVDVMLDVGFLAQISQIVALWVAALDERRKSIQMLFFSATISDAVEGMVKQILDIQSEQQYIRIDVCTSESKTGTQSFAFNSNVLQQVRWSEDKVKKNLLFEFLKGKNEESTIIFVGSKIGATMLAEAIQKRCQIGAAAIHADKTQTERLQILDAFINLEIPVLVSTNVLSRGMDLLHVQNVVVYDFPKKVSDYVHLIGRTGRGDESIGNALTLVNKGDQSVFGELVVLLRQAKVSVPREVYQSIHTEHAKLRARSIQVVIDESKRAFRVRKQLVDEISTQASEWKDWDNQRSKRRRTGP